MKLFVSTEAKICFVVLLSKIELPNRYSAVVHSYLRSSLVISNNLTRKVDGETMLLFYRSTVYSREFTKLFYLFDGLDCWCCCYPIPSDGWLHSGRPWGPRSRQLSRAWTNGRKETEVAKERTRQRVRS